MTDEADIIIDVGNFVSWVSLLKVTQAFDGMPPSSILEIRGTDPETKQDLFRILPEETYRVLTMDNESGNRDTCRIRIQKHA